VYKQNKYLQGYSMCAFHFDMLHSTISTNVCLMYFGCFQLPKYVLVAMLWIWFVMYVHLFIYGHCPPITVAYVGCNALIRHGFLECFPTGIQRALYLVLGRIVNSICWMIGIHHYRNWIVMPSAIGNSRIILLGAVALDRFAQFSRYDSAQKRWHWRLG